MTAKESTSGTGPSAADRIPLAQLAAYGAGGIIPIALFNIAGILVGLMGNISLGLSALWLGVILVIPRLWDAVCDPVIGHLSDNTQTRWGRRRPYLLIGGLLVAFFFVVIWWIPKADAVHGWFPTEAGYHWFQLGFILVTLILFFTSVTIFEIPHGALGMEMTTDSHERTRLFSAKSFVGNLFAMSTPWLFALANMDVFKGPGGNEADGMRYVSLLVAALVVPLSFWWFFTLREPAFRRAAKQAATPFWQDMRRTLQNRNFIVLTLTIFTLAMGFNFVQLLGSYIPIFYVFGGDKAASATLLGINGTVWAISGLLAVFPLNWISPRLGKRNTLAVAILLIALAQLSKIACYSPSHPYLTLVPTVLNSCGMLFFFTLGSSMVGDICDEAELTTGHRSDGSYYAVFWWFIKMGTALASVISGALIVLTMFDETQVTQVDKLQGSVREVRASHEAWSGKDHDGARGSEPQGVSTKQPVEALEDTTQKLQLAAANAAELRSYFEAQATTSQKSRAHYEQLARTAQELGGKLSNMAAQPHSSGLDAELAGVEAALVPLMKQAPQTLLMMRIFEIGLPLLACFFSMLFVLRYALTETRSREIKQQLAQRHAEHDTRTAPAVV
ncbi:MAG: transporter [Myxococcaceae bacterium]|nr:transporter [Myxococcaceae bacterium]